mgnify:CR=1 FL=1|tara:strand:- start:617 stop:1591 length:975 start_codon:yes stop_codon:yes gene_type:complete
MLPDDFDFAMLPPGATSTTLESLGMLGSSIEDIDFALVSWVKKDLNLSAKSNEGYVQVPVLWQTPERSYQIKNNEALRDEAGALKLPLISVERTNIAKDPARKGAYQAQTYSTDKNGRTGRIVLAKRIKQDKTRNFAVAAGTRTSTEAAEQYYYPRVNQKLVIQYLSIPIPVYINVDYKIVIKTEYQQQMNELMMPFMARTGQINSFVMRQNGHMYEAFINQDFTHNNNVSNLDEDLRMFSTEITIRVLGYLIGEGPNDDRPIVRIDENFVEITYPSETVVSGEDSWFGGAAIHDDSFANEAGTTTSLDYFKMTLTGSSGFKRF